MRHASTLKAGSGGLALLVGLALPLLAGCDLYGIPGFGYPVVDCGYDCYDDGYYDYYYEDVYYEDVYYDDYYYDDYYYDDGYYEDDYYGDEYYDDGYYDDGYYDEYKAAK